MYNYNISADDLPDLENVWDSKKLVSGASVQVMYEGKALLPAKSYFWKVRVRDDSGRRFPVFWGPGYDWTPDHNWGGSGMTGLQEMLMQTSGRKIYLLPAWPQNWDVHFKLHAPYDTTVEAVVIKGKIVSLNVMPSSRKKDVEVMIR